MHQTRVVVTSAGPQRLLFVCNALADDVRLQRGITSDSPAASRKIFMMLAALHRRRLYPFALSLGRGRREASGRDFAVRLIRSRHHATIYLPFSNRRLWSEVLSLIAPAITLWRLRRAAPRTTVLFYNRERAYLLALVTARLLGYRTALDLEDGDVGPTLFGRLRGLIYDRLCTGGALIACTALERSTALRPVLCYYGIVHPDPAPRDWHAPVIAVLLGGTLTSDTGVMLLTEAIRRLRQTSPAWATALELHVTGKGEALPLLHQLAAMPDAPRIIVHGRTSDTDYAALLRQMHVGLALKLNDGALAHTTFPSKVTELAGAGLLVLSTDISDVRAVLGDGAVYLEQDDPDRLIECLQTIVANRDAARQLASCGQARVAALCAPDPAGDRLARHLFPASS